MARVEIIVGPMFSGKSTELIRRCSRYESIGLRALVVNHVVDSRCDTNEIKTHSNTRHHAVKVSSLSDFDLSTIPDVIAVDEAQFFEHLTQFVLRCNEECPRAIVVIAGLDGDYLRRPFGEILQCIPLADEVTKLNAMCNVCKNGIPAIFTKKLDISNTDLVTVGGKDKFISVCRSHY